MGRRVTWSLALGLALSAPTMAAAQYDDEEPSEQPKAEDPDAYAPDAPAPAAPAPAAPAPPAAPPPSGGAPSAQEKETARHLMDVGDEHFAAERFEQALQAYRGAHNVMGVPSTGYAMGRSLERTGKLLEARDVLLGVTRMPQRPNEPSAFVHARTKSGALAQAIAGRIPTVRVAPEGLPQGSDYTVTVDAKALPASLSALPIRLNPGEHSIRITAPGFASDDEKITIKEGERRVLKLAVSTVEGAPFSPKPATAADPNPKPSEFPPGETSPDEADGGGLSPLVYVGFGSAGVGLLVGAITGAMSMGKTSDLEEACGGDQSCPPSAEADHDAAATLSHISTVGFAIGIAGAGVGVVGLLMSGGGDGESESEAALRPIVAPGYLGVGGTF